jgi:hypothetical protein
MAGKKTEGPATLGSHHDLPPLASDVSDERFDWVDYTCPCPRCGAEVAGFRTRDLCNQMDTLDYRIAYHFYARCRCGAWLDFMRKPADGIEDFDTRVERL